MSNNLILRIANSPYGDVTKGSVLTQSELDDNFIFLKGNIIYTALTDNGIVTLKKYNGEDIVFSGGTGGGGTGSDTYWTSGSTGFYSLIPINDSTTDATGDYAIAINHNTLASGLYSFAQGTLTIASGATSHAEGSGSIAGGVAAHAEGSQTQALGEDSHAQGHETQALGQASHAEGYMSNSVGMASHAEGGYNYDGEVRIGGLAIGHGSHAEGSETVSGWKGFLISSIVNGVISLNSIYGDVTNQFPNSILILDGKKYTYNSVSFNGSKTIINLDDTTVDSGFYVADLYNLNSQNNDNYFGISSHAEGVGSYSLGNFSHAEGFETLAGGDSAHAEGNDTIALAQSSHAEGAATIASGLASHAEGLSTLASGDYSHAEGANTTASGVTSHAEGAGTTAGGDYSHAEGINTIASGEGSHAEGYQAVATNQGSHAEGSNTLASGPGAHAEGANTVASGQFSHTEGLYTVASGEVSHAGGYGYDGNVVAEGVASFAHQFLTGGGQFGPGDYGAYANYSVVLGGKDHYLSSGSDSGLIIGGDNHLLYGNSVRSGIFAGYSNLLIDTYNGVVLGGEANGTIQADGSAIVGGYNNLIDAYAYNLPPYGFIGGGQNNKIQTGGGSSDESSAIIGGNGNTISGDNQYNVIINSYQSTLTNQDTSTIIGSYQSYINDYTGGLTSHNNDIINAANSLIDGYGVSHANILGGSSNLIIQNVDGVNQPNFTSILNGYGNVIEDSDTAVILNGYNNNITQNSKQSSILNGQNHALVSSQFAAIIGGNSNQMTDSDGSALIGGSQNQILSDGNPAFTRYYNAILGGTGNTINNGELCFIMGGYQNVIPYGTVGSVILGGDSITANSNNTVFVQRLNIKYAQNDNLTTKLLTIDSNGLVKYRDVSSISGGTGGSGGTTVDLYWASGTTGTNSLKRNNGSTTDATANYAFAEGYNVLASGQYSHAEGNGTESRNRSSHAQNEGTLAKGDYSHAGGFNSVASGSTSFVHSYQSTAIGDRTVVLGGQGIAGNVSDTVYVPYLNIQSATTDNTLINVLVRDTDGSIKLRSLSNGITATTISASSIFSTTITANTVNSTTISATTYLNLPTDIRVTGGTYSNGTAIFTNNTGGTFNVTGFKTSDLVVTGGTYNSGTGIATFTNNTGGTFTVSGFNTGGNSGPSVTAFTYNNANTFTITNSTGGTLTSTINTMTGLTINGNFTYTGQSNNPVYNAGSVTATHTPNWNNSNIQTVTLTAATTTIANGTNVKDGAVYTMILKQNASGSRTVTWGTQYKWQSGIAPILTATANAVDILTFISDGTSLYGLIAKDFR